jgi:hypothetical protein
MAVIINDYSEAVKKKQKIISKDKVKKKQSRIKKVWRKHIATATNFVACCGGSCAVFNCTCYVLFVLVAWLVSIFLNYQN